jgi:hypothetical protein
LSDYGLQDVIDHVTEEYEAEGAKPNRSHFLRLINSALAIIFEQAKPLTKTWASTDLTISDAKVQIPSDCISISEVRWNGEQLYQKSRGEMNYFSADWESETGSDPVYYVPEGMFITLYPNPTNADTNLTISGFAYPEKVPVGAGVVDPMSYIPRGSQLLLAYYALANLPYDPENPRQAARVARNQAKWDSGWPLLVNQLQSFKSEPYGAI